jgi:ferredoxin-NADP reductase
MKLFLESVKQEAGDACSFVFRPETPLVWQAGQFMHYNLIHPNPDSRKTERYFTIASAPYEKNIMITTRLIETASSFKKTLKTMPVGSTIDADGPAGEFTVPDDAGEAVFIAGGIGITPFRSILLDRDHRGLPVNATLMYANSTENFVFREELETLAKRQPGLKIIYFVGGNRIDEAAIRRTVADIARPVFFVSGPEPMVQALEAVLKDMGVLEANLKRDYFPGYDWP